jgi:hypothetical protein
MTEASQNEASSSLVAWVESAARLTWAAQSTTWTSAARPARHGSCWCTA